MHQHSTAFENIVRKGEIAISPFLTMFSTQSDMCIPIFPHFDIISQFASELEDSKIGICGKELRKYFNSSPWTVRHNSRLPVLKTFCI